MGAYKYLENQVTHVGKGIKRTSDGAVIPPNTELAAWQEFLVWLAVPNTPDAADSTNLTEYKRKRKAEIDAEAELEFRKDVRLQKVDSALVALHIALLIEELYRYEADGSPVAANYPQMNALVGVEGVSLAAVATAMRTWYDGVKGRISLTGAPRWKGHKDVNAAASVAAVDAITVTFPAGGAGE